MSIAYSFQSVVAPDLQRYIALKRVLGRSFDNSAKIFFDLDCFLSGLGKATADLTPETFQKWSQTLEPLHPNTRLARMRAVRNFCLYRRRTIPACFVPDPTQFPRAGPVVRPYIFSGEEVAKLLLHCKDLRGSPLRRATTRLAIVLLYTTGLRRGELLRLTLQDYDPQAQTLLIRASKFHKSRLLPLPGDVVEEVKRFLQVRRAARPSLSPTASLLWSPCGQGLAYSANQIAKNVHILFERAGIKKPDGRQPRVHDFRHSLAVNVLIRWYQAGVDVQAKLPLLATWLGHVSILSTYHYLHFVEGLRSAASRRFDRSFGDLVVPLAKQKGGPR
ncbi:MAG TPA: tyrosine-type recombinase/integrase [Terriglobales bacterium]